MSILKIITKNKSVGKNTSYYLISNIVNASIPFLLLPILTRYLNPDDYGTVSIFQVLQSIMFTLIGFNTSSAIAVNYFKIEAEKLKEYIFNVILISIISLFIFQTLFYFFSEPISSLFEIKEELLLFVLLSAFFGIINKINLVLWQVEKRPIPYGLMNISVTIVNLGISLFFILIIHLNWEGRIAGIVIANILSGLYSIIFIYRRNYIKVKINFIFIKDALKFGIPLIPENLSEWINKSLNRIFLVAIIGLSAAGFFAVGNQIGAAVALISAAFYKSFLPFAFEKLKENTDEAKLFLTKYILRYFMGIIILALILSFTSPLMIGNIIDEKYSTSIDTVIWIALGYSFLGMFSVLSVFLLYMKKTNIILVISLTTVILNIILNYFLINLYGIQGAAITLTLTYLVKLIVGFYFIKKYVDIPWKDGFKRIFV